MEVTMLSIFDFDDTLAKSDSWVYIKTPDGKEKKLNPAEYATYKLKKGEIEDFRDFDRQLRNPKIIKKNVNLLRKQLKKGGRRVTILTARRLSEESSTLEDLSKKYKISRERIRQIETKAFEKLQKAMLNAAKSNNLLPKN